MVLTVLSVLLLGMVPPSSDADPALRVFPPAVAAPSVVVADPSAWTDAVSASGVLVADLDSGQDVVGVSTDTRRSIASLTKLMTAILIVENHEMDDVVTVSKAVNGIEGQTINLKAGERYTVGDLLTAMLVQSANDAAVTLAVHHSGSVQAFVEEMNLRASMLGLRNTSFTNPAGLDEAGHYSTLRDVKWLAVAALRHPEIAERMGESVATIHGRGTDARTITLHHTHALLGRNDAVLLGKTGTTPEAGQCLVSLVRGGSHTYVVILLGSRDRYADMRQVLKEIADLPV